MITLEEARALLPYLSEDALRAWREPYTKQPATEPIVERPFQGVAKVPELQGHYYNPPIEKYGGPYYYSSVRFIESFKPLTSLPLGSISSGESWSLFAFLMCVGDKSTLSPDELIAPYTLSNWRAIVERYLEVFDRTTYDHPDRPHQYSALLYYAGCMLRGCVSWDDFKAYIESIASRITARYRAALDEHGKLSDASIKDHCRHENNVMCQLLRGFTSYCDIPFNEVTPLVELCLDCDHTVEVQSTWRIKDVPFYRTCHFELLSHVPVSERIGKVSDWYSIALPSSGRDNRAAFMCLVWCDVLPPGVTANIKKSERLDQEMFMRFTSRFGEELAHALTLYKKSVALPDVVLSTTFSERLYSNLGRFLTRRAVKKHTTQAPISPNTVYPKGLLALIINELSESNLVWPLMRDKLSGMAQHGHLPLITQAISSLDEQMQHKVQDEVITPHQELLPQKSWPAEAKRWYKLARDPELLNQRWRACLGDDRRLGLPEDFQVLPMLELQTGGYLPHECSLGFLLCGMEGKLASADKIKARYTARSLDRLCWCTAFQRSTSYISEPEERALAPFLSQDFVDYAVRGWHPGRYAPYERNFNMYNLYQIREYGDKLRSSYDKSQHEAWKVNFAKKHELTQDELDDLSVWDFGLDAQGRRLFSYGERTFELSLDGVELMLKDLQKQSFIKRLPPKRKGDDLDLIAHAKATYKKVDKPLKAELITQGERLEEAMLFKRMWTFGRAKETLFSHPVHAALTRTLIWVMPSKLKRGTSKGMFRVTQDGSLIDVEMNEVKVSSRTNIRLAHPADLVGVIPAWTEHLTSFNIVQPFAQLDHTVFIYSEETERMFNAFISGERVLSCEALQLVDKQELWSLEWSDGSRYEAKRAHHMSLVREGHMRFKIKVEPFRFKSTQTILLGWLEVDLANRGYRATAPTLMKTAKGLSPEIFSALMTLLTECELK